MRTRLAFGLALIALASSGCSLLFRGADYVGNDNTGPDGGDGGRRDGGDGGPEVNRAPIASGVGLSTYRPLLGDALRAMVGPVFDPDGDGVTTNVVWKRNDEVLPGETGTSLTLDPSRFAAGDRIRVELQVSDGDLESDVVWAEARIEDDTTTRWRRILPPRVATDGGAFDAAGQRIVFFASTGGDQSLWEMQLTNGVGRLVQLHPTGTPPDVGGGTFLYDAAGKRLLYSGGRDRGVSSDRIVALSLDERGREAWSDVITAGPSARMVSAVTYAEQGGRAWMFGGIGETSVLGDLYEVNLASASFTSVGPTHPSPTVGPALLHDAARNRLIMLGGGRFASGVPEDGFPEPTDDIEVLDLANPSAGFQRVGALPFPLIGGTGFVRGDRGYIVLGIREASLDGFHTGVLEVDLATLDVTMHAATGSPSGLIPVVTPRAPFSDTVFVWGRGVEEGGGVDAHELAVGTRTFTPLARPDQFPAPVMHAAGGTTREGYLLLAGGLNRPRDGSVVQQTWRFERGSWVPVTVMPHPTQGSPPGLRWGSSVDPSSPWNEWRVWQVFGAYDGGGLAPFDDVWHSEGNRWLRFPVSGASPVMPVARRGQSTFPGTCAGPDESGVVRGNRVGVFGGESASGMLLGDAAMLNCALPDREDPLDCRWFEMGIVGSPRPPARAWAATAVAGADEHERNRTAFIFGGRGSTGPLDDVWQIDTCSDDRFPAPWHPVVVTGAVPSPRFGHSATHVPSEPAENGATVLLFGGGTNPDIHGVLDDVWRFVPDGFAGPVYEGHFEPIVVTGERPQPRMFHIAWWDAAGTRLIVYGGAADERTVLDDMWELRIRD